MFIALALIAGGIATVAFVAKKRREAVFEEPVVTQEPILTEKPSVFIPEEPEQKITKPPTKKPPIKASEIKPPTKKPPIKASEIKPRIPRITSLNQALVSKWVTPEAKVLINRTVGRMIVGPKFIQLKTYSAKELESILTNKYVMAIRTQDIKTPLSKTIRAVRIDFLRILIFESLPHTWSSIPYSAMINIKKRLSSTFT